MGRDSTVLVASRRGITSPCPTTYHSWWVGKGAGRICFGSVCSKREDWKRQPLSNRLSEVRLTPARKCIRDLECGQATKRRTCGWHLSKNQTMRLRSALYAAVSIKNTSRSTGVVPQLNCHRRGTGDGGFLKRLSGVRVDIERTTPHVIGSTRGHNYRGTRWHAICKHCFVPPPLARALDRAAGRCRNGAGRRWNTPFPLGPPRPNDGRWCYPR